MAHYQNQYGAVPASAAKDPIQKEMETAGDTTGVGVGGGGGGPTQVIAEDYEKEKHHDHHHGHGHGHGHGDDHHDGDDHSHEKKGILEKIKEKLPGSGTQHKPQQ
ncbi:dehydrin DHN3-like [Cajanus cajan]|uniref:dehydrin DHN3-like n=1 Tax=Cajanus cajan TaxID=3821 RepID=UPI00098D8C10|nr:dehydrin DHN3-like [Cajanus cajan]